MKRERRGEGEGGGLMEREREGGGREGVRKGQQEREGCNNVMFVNEPHTSLWKYMRPLAQAATTDMAWILASSGLG